MKTTALSILCAFTLMGFIHSQIPTGTLISETIQSVSISNNNNIFSLPSHPVLVYLPPSYSTNENKRYPVLYYLGGYSEKIKLEYRDHTNWSGGYHILRSNNNLITNGTSKEIIMVVAQGLSEIKGAFYVNSIATSNWEDFVVRDLVNYMDTTYRTIPKASSRALAGLSMGGFGALNLSMKHPDVFSMAYGISSGLFDENGLEESFVFNDTNTIHAFLNVQDNLASQSRENAHSNFMEMIKGLSSRDRFQYAYGLAFSPDTSINAPYIIYPYSRVNGNLVMDSLVWQNWESGYGNLEEKIELYKDSLLKLNGYFFDYGTEDQYAWIPKGNKYYSNLLMQKGIPHKAFEHEGTHVNRTRERIESYLMPLCDSLLLFDEQNLNREAEILHVNCYGFINMEKSNNISGRDTLKIFVKDYVLIDSMSLNLSLSPGAKITPSPSEIRNYSDGAISFEVTSESGKDIRIFDLIVCAEEVNSLNDPSFQIKNEVNVYPNPSLDGIVNMEFSYPVIDDYSLTIYDFSCKKLNTIKGVKEQKITLDLSAYTNSVVFIVIQNSNISICKKIVLIK